MVIITMNVYAMLKIMNVVGTRPEIIKMAPIIREIEYDDRFEQIIVHTGQHYDFEMSKTFFDCLNIKYPDENLESGSGTHAEHLAHMILGLEKLINKYEPDILLAQGDTNSVLAAGIVCVKMKVLFGHVEAGIRSYDMTMPEEINRRIADVTANVFFAPSERSAINLLREGFNPERVYVTGNTVIDATLYHINLAKEQHSMEIKDLLENIDKTFILTTFHRPSNVDIKENFEEIIKTFEKMEHTHFIYPIHPRSKQKAKEHGLYDQLLNLHNVSLLEPLDYLSFLYLMSHASIILTDSGGIQEEAITLRKPCITVRKNTERPETVELGVNFLCEPKCEEILRSMKKIQSERFSEKIEKIKNPYGEGDSAKKILDILFKNYTKLQFNEISTIELNGKIDFGLHFVQQDIEKEKLEERLDAKIVVIYNEDGKPLYDSKIIKKGFFVEYSYVTN